MKIHFKPFVSILLLGIIIISCTINNYYDCCCDDGSNGSLYPNQIIMQPNAKEGKDAFIEDYPLRDYSNSNFGAHEAFQASAWTAQGIPFVTRSLIDFDFSKIPRNVKIITAKLILYPAENTAYGTGHSSRSGSNKFVVQKIISPWDEFIVTWNNQPLTSTNNQIFVAASEYSMLNYEIIITSLVKDILDNPSQSHGLMIKLTTEDYYRRVLFASSDYEDSSKHPKLIIDYE